jgi:hypothetical protein
VDPEALGGAAGLARVAQAAPDEFLRRQLDVAVRKDNEGVFAQLLGPQAHKTSKSQ